MHSNQSVGIQLVCELTGCKPLEREKAEKANKRHLLNKSEILSINRPARISVEKLVKNGFKSVFAY